MQAAVMQWVLMAVVVALTAASQTLNMPECEGSVCGCPEPNVRPGDIKTGTDANGTCLCACGRKAGALCDTSDHCGKGTFCGAPHDIVNLADKSKGVCIDKCKQTKCPAFNKCVLGSDGEPRCQCQTYKCDTREDAVRPYRAQLDGRILVFNSMCEMVQNNCERKKANPMATLWKFVHDHGETDSHMADHGGLSHLD